AEAPLLENSPIDRPRVDRASRGAARALRNLDSFRMVRADEGRRAPLFAVRGKARLGCGRARLPLVVLADLAVGVSRAVQRSGREHGRADAYAARTTIRAGSLADRVAPLV